MFLFCLAFLNQAACVRPCFKLFIFYAFFRLFTIDSASVLFFYLHRRKKYIVLSNLKEYLGIKPIKFSYVTSRQHKMIRFGANLLKKNTKIARLGTANFSKDQVIGEENGEIKIGDISKKLKKAHNQELVPSKNCKYSIILKFITKIKVQEKSNQQMK